MTKGKIIIVSSLLLWGLGGSEALLWAQTRASGMREYSTSQAYHHFEFGARSYHFNLLDTRRHGKDGLDNANWERGRNVNYIGSLWGLDENQNYLPRPYFQWVVNDYFGLGVSYDYLTMKTVDWANEEKTRTGSDGDLFSHGCLFYVFVRYPLFFGIAPFGELGGAWYKVDFTESAKWVSRGDEYRIKVDNASGYYIGLGLNANISRDWSLNLYWRQMYDAEADARAFFSPSSSPNRVGSFPMEYRMMALGAAFHF